MKFSPSDFPKNPILQDTKKKVHVKFGDEDKEPKIVKKRPAPVPGVAGQTPDQALPSKKRKLAENKSGAKSIPIGIPGGTSSPLPSNRNKNIKKQTGPKTPRSTLGKNLQGKGKNLSLQSRKAKPLTDEERLAKKLKRREKKKARRDAQKTIGGEKVFEPTLQFDLSKLKQHIKVDDIRSFLISTLTDTPTPEWVKINNRGHIKKAVVLYLPGLDPADFGLTGITNYETDGVPKYVDLKKGGSSSSSRKDKAPAAYKSMPFFIQQFSKMLVSILPAKRKDVGKEFVQMLQCQVSLNERKRRAILREKRLEECKGNMNEFYMFSHAELKQYRYPIPPFLDPSVTLPEGWKETNAPKEVLPHKRLMAVDCEMVKTASGSALARVTLVDEDGTTLLDEIVLPDEPVVDYLTQYSGMTRDILKDGISLRRAQKHVRKLVTHNVILIGHGLENDLNALKLAHPYCADTAILYDSQLGPPNKPPLRVLARTYLRRIIQKRDGDKTGHDSAEDARAALDLFKLKVKKGENFGTTKLDMELIFNRLDQVKPSRTSALLEKADTPRYLMSIMYPAEYIVCDTEEKLVQETIGANKKHNFVISQFRTLKYLDEEDMSEVPTVFSYDVDQKKRMMHERMITFDQYFQQMYRSFEPGTMVFVMGSYSPELLNNKILRRYRESLKKHPSEEQDPWTEYDDLNLDILIRKSRYGSLFFTIKGYGDS